MSADLDQRIDKAIQGVLHVARLQAAKGPLSAWAVGYFAGQLAIMQTGFGADEEKIRAAQVDLNRIESDSKGRNSAA